MKGLASVLAAASLFVAPVAGAQVSETDFEAKTAGELAQLCGASGQDAWRGYAIGFCYGWIAGVEQFYDALVADPRFDIDPTICPDGEISREEARTQFLAWMKANPGQANAASLDGMIQALRAKYPC